MAASSAAAGAGGEPQKQLLSIIRDFAAEKSHGGFSRDPLAASELLAERRVTDLKRRLDDLRAASDAAAAELEAAKRAREGAEQELRGGQVQVAIAAASIQALEATISHLQEEISKAGSDLDALKGKGDIERDEFISQMDQLNTKIRQFQQTVSVEFKRQKCSELPSGEGQHVRDMSKIEESEGILKDLIDKVNNADAELHVLEEEYKKDLLHHDEVRRELADTQAKRALMEAVMGETKQLQELGEYPFLGFVQKFSNSLHLVLFPVQIHQAFCKRRFFNGKQAGSRNGESARFACGGVAEAVRVPRLWSQQHGWVGGGGGGQLKMALAGWLLYIDKA
ncbi:Os06g0244200 [Oryza sativa Japonica Group]|uniref:Os06g0244200 protein n=1 Tax=Oryza sativa subsp. japonica TaxID=39947 RepID=Q654G6_ORYSJ|nr:hypothetical protein [Oryza sativa Japonica Group]BAH93418.1 Os06g0244200 [Oryza sativa Japonica Group]|eukprot:NP_001174690.1 Os06g0244200 [Oryza sativa Japonica Group]